MINRLTGKNALNLHDFLQERETTGARSEADTSTLQSTLDRLAPVLRRHDARWITRDEATGQDLTPALCREAAELERKSVPEPPQLEHDPEPDEVTRRAGNRGAEVGRARDAARVWNLFADWLQSGEHICPYIELSGRGRDAGIHLTWANRVKRSWRETQMLVLDATADARLTAAFVPNLDVVDIQSRLPENVLIRLICDVSCAQRRLVDEDGGNLDDQKHAKKTRKRIADHAHFNKSSLVGQKRLVEKLLDEHSLDPSATAHYNALRGLNALEDVPHHAVVGRTLPAAREAARIAAAVTGRWVDPDADYERRRVPVWGQDERRLGTLDGLMHPDDDADRVRAQIAGAELAQAVHRARPATRDDDTPVKIDVIAHDTVPPVPVGQLTSLAAVEPRVVDWASLRGVVPLTYSTLHAVAPLYPSAEALKKACQRENRTPPPFDSKGGVSPIRAKARTLFTLYCPSLAYRRVRLSVPALTRKTFVALLDPAMSRDRLSQVFGMEAQIEEDLKFEFPYRIRDFAAPKRKWDLEKRSAA